MVRQFKNVVYRNEQFEPGKSTAFTHCLSMEHEPVISEKNDLVEIKNSELYVLRKHL